MIYLDNNATTSMDLRVLEAMEAVLKGPPANASSMHAYGRHARGLLSRASQRIAAILGVREGELIYTSGASEALALAIRGFARKGHIVVSTLEHVATLSAVAATGREVTYVQPIDNQGFVSACQIEAALRPDTCLIIVMGANNETGVMSPIEEIAQLAEGRAIDFLVDGVGHFGRAPFALPSGVTLFALSGHKLHGPHGVGLLVARRSVALNPLIEGGPQQRGRRGGTENLAGIVGVAEAIALAEETDFERIAALRDRFEDALVDVTIHGKGQKRVSNTSSIAFKEISGETLFMHLDRAGVIASFGSACSSGSLEPSRVLLGMGLAPEVALSTLRFSLSRNTTSDEIDRAVEVLVNRDYVPRWS